MGNLNSRTTVTYDVPPEEVGKIITNQVKQSFEEMLNGVFIEYDKLPPIINRQTFCLLTGITEGRYHALILAGEIKCKTRVGRNKVSYDVSKEEFWKFFKSLKQKQNAKAKSH